MQSKSDLQCLQFIRQEIRDSIAYPSSNINAVCKLDAMEMPYNLDDHIKSLWLDRIRQCQINRYPINQILFKERLKAYFAIPSHCDVLTGNGSDELLQILAMAVAHPSACALSISPDFSMYPIIANNCGIQHVTVPLKKDFSFDLTLFLEAIEQHQPAIIWLSRPNNPTGKVWNKKNMDQIITHSSAIVLVDEAYQAFYGESYIDRLDKFDNLLISKTFSKIGFAGLRFGVLLGHSSLIAELDKLRLPYNVNSLTQASIEFVMDYQDHFDKNINLIKEQRQRLFDLLSQINQVTPIPSQTNFMLVHIACNSIQYIYDNLCAKGILVKLCNEEVLKGYIRVTVGNEQDNDMFVNQLQTILKATT